MKEVVLPAGSERSESVAFAACVAAILECSLSEVPAPRADQDAPPGWLLSRWLGGLGLGLAPIANARSFSWAGPWIARLRAARSGERRPVVMYGVPSGVVWDPAGITQESEWQIEDGFCSPPATSRLAARPARTRRRCPGPCMHYGSRLPPVNQHANSSGPPHCYEFAIGAVRCRGMRLCEPCTVIEGYSTRPILRSLIHRGGLRADILSDGEIFVGDLIRSIPDS